MQDTTRNKKMSCPGGQEAPQWCPVGTFNQLTAQSDITSCQACPDGYISLETRAGCRLCPNGFWCDPQRGWQGSCIPGQYSPEGEIDCQECPKGYICPNGQEKRHCLGGHEPDPSHTSCVPCFPGFFSSEGSPDCQPCLTGHYCPHVGTVQPVPCPPGSWAHAPRQIKCQRDNTSSCCPDDMAEMLFAWKSIHSAGGLQSQLCPSGYFHSSGMTTSPCPRGSFEPREKSLKLSNRSSYFPGLKQCLKCPVGYFCPNGMSYPNPCPVGTYNPLQGQDESTDCRTCPAGKACTQTGLAQPDSDCMLGLRGEAETTCPMPSGTLLPSGYQTPNAIQVCTWHVEQQDRSSSRKRVCTMSSRIILPGRSQYSIRKLQRWTFLSRRYSNKYSVSMPSRNLQHQTWE
ncbi:uncharacterized protein PHA67_001199 [Liasis olivaceus]